jgi:hypothetical protein
MIPCAFAYFSHDLQTNGLVLAELCSALACKRTHRPNDALPGCMLSRAIAAAAIAAAAGGVRRRVLADQAVALNWSNPWNAVSARC